MSKFDISRIEGVNVLIGDQTQFNAASDPQHRRSAEDALASLEELTGQVRASTEGIRSVEKAIAELREELSRPRPRKERVKSLLGALRSGAETAAAVAVGVDKVRETLHMLS